ncbi:MAG: thioredoxin-like domain-containing protein [Akkermansiaceae bacterium]|nr:thioredoxin-like domain-containing protein [Akkermansiaceae bacterium]
MKLLTSLLLASTLPLLAEYRDWTNSEGKTAELELYGKEEKDGEVIGVFRMKSGKTVRIKASQLSDQDATALTEFNPDQADASGGPDSVFDDILEGNLVQLDGSKLKRLDDFQKPGKYYLFYYTASWCPPCRAFTPSLVTWYKDNKNDNFELVLVTSDQDKGAMETYAKKNKMPWPQVKHSKVGSAKKKLNHGVSGIPSLIVCDLEGKVLGNYRSNLPGLSDLVKD